MATHAHTPSRRNALRLFAGAATIGASPVLLVGATKAHSATIINDDAAILSALDRWTLAHRELRQLPEGADDTHVWAAMDREEILIEQTPAKAPRAAEAALWIALEHIDDHNIPRGAASERDFAQLHNNRHLDWDSKMIVRAIANLRAMEV